MTQQYDMLGEMLESTPHLTVSSEQVARLREGGAAYIPHFISSEEEASLIAALEREAWITDLRRRVQHYGYRYDYTKRGLTEDDKIGDLPTWILPVCERLVVQGLFATCPDQMIVNEYEPGQGIAPHADRNCFGEVVASLSLESDCLMDIYPDPKDRKCSFPIVLERCSLLVLRGPAREMWLHGIRPNKADIQDGSKLPRAKRVSLTFRTVLSPA